MKKARCFLQLGLILSRVDFDRVDFERGWILIVYQGKQLKNIISKP